MRLSHRLYYLLKPVLPWRVRMATRQALARRTLAANRDTWPILPIAAQKPEGWPGWPDGKRFALVLTHDVEGTEGLAQCRQLAELEMSLGVRSCFNFVPEGDYQVPDELRAWLLENGFEVGVHDLHHDGKLYSSRDAFRRSAAAINRYLRDWGAVGYRSGFMLRNHAWHHDLDVLYDATSFDTDPFEPQAEGAGTIFPFWLTSPDDRQRGYVELPYTLPQDSTLFFVLQEKTPEIWLRKLDWIASHGGMALVNVHPDYINFSSAPDRARQYSASLYADLLRHVQAKYAGQFWNPLPRDLATWYKARCVPAASPVTPRPLPAELPGKRAAVLLYSRYPSDPRPRRAAEAMIAAGMQVDLLCLSDSPSDPREEIVGGVNVTRLRLTHRRDSKWLYLWQYGRFFVASFWFLLTRASRRRYDVVHVHNMPDFLVFAALLPKLCGARVLLDLHDPMPELMQSIYNLAPGAWTVRILRWLERWSIAFADLVLTPNIAFKTLFASRNSRPGKIEIVMNSPQPDIFDPDRAPPPDATPSSAGEFRVMHHGLIAHRHGVDQLVEAVARLRPTIPGIRLDIYGRHTPFLDTVLARAAELGAADIVRYHGAKSQPEIAAAISRCHVGVIPNRRLVFTECNFPTRIFEYLALQRPVIAPRTQGIRDYFQADDLLMFEPGDVDDLVRQLRFVHDDPAATRRFVERGVTIYRRHQWPEEKRRFLEATAALLPSQS